ncbi:MAG: hypothetical protein AB7U52_06265 [Candidatus Izemoplasmatales bacterium]
MFIVGMLQQFEDKAAKKQNRTPATVVVNSYSDSLKNISSMYERNKNQIIVNESVLNELNIVELFATVMHEGRHAYQWQQILNPEKSVEDKALIDQWKEEFLNYKQDLANQNDPKYLTLAIEVDAVAYTAMNMLRLSDMRIQIHPVMKELVEKRQSELKDKFYNF